MENDYRVVNSVNLFASCLSDSKNLQLTYYPIGAQTIKQMALENQ